MNLKTIGILYLSSTLFSLIDVIVYSNYAINKGYGFWDIMKFKDIMTYLASPIGSTLTVLSIGPLIILYVLANKQKNT